MSILDNTNYSNINENEGDYKREENYDNKTKAFDKLLQLQLLIQKHSGLKELCK